MAKTVDYYYTLSSPWTYLGSRRLAEIARRRGAEVRHKPSDFARVFSVSGGLPLPKRAPQRQAYRLVELKRWHAYLDIPLNLEPRHFPVDAAPAARLVIAAARAGHDVSELAHAIHRACWTEERDIADRATLVAIADGAGLDGAALAAAADAPEIAAAYAANTEEAIARQVFGAPTYIYRGEPFWGQDRLDFLERALAEG